MAPISAYAAVEQLTADVGDVHAHRAGQSRCRGRRSTTATSPRSDAVSGVNLDEEAANMLRYQQAYAAAAQIIAVANEMFDDTRSTR